MKETVRKKKALDFFNSIQELMGYLSSRWQDEQGYENINDYKKRLQVEASKFGIKITDMLSRPFGFYFTIGGCTYKLTANSRACEYKRVS